MSNSHIKLGWISFNGKVQDSITDCDDARKYLEIFFFRKVLLVYRSLQFNLDVLFIYSKENCIIWHLHVLASISALLVFVSSTGIPAFSNKYTHRLTHYWLKGDSIEFIVFYNIEMVQFCR